jgi:PAS domain S-box-containing protein
MNKPVKILIVEDQPNDFELATREIEQVLNSCEFDCVETKEEFIESLQNFQPDLIVSDYTMPHFDGLSVISLAQQHVPLVPVIILTGSIDEETAAESVKAGAVDYVIKENIIRLRHAVLHALEKKQMWLDRITAEEKLRASEERYRLISTVSSDYMFSTIVTPDDSLDLNWVAGAFEKITGYSVAEYKQAGGWRFAIFKDDKVIDKKDFEKLKANQKVISEIRTIKKGGEIVWVRIYAHPVWNESKDCLVGIYGAVQDISDRKKAEEETIKLNKDLEKLVKERTRELEILNNTKDKFFSIIAHDLKNPVAGIISSTEMLIKTLNKNPDDKERLNKYSENILTSTRDGYKLLENLLEWARAQTGAIKYEPQDIRLTESIKECANSMKLMFDNKNIKIIFPEKSFMVFADKNMMCAVVRNMLSNAIKYSFPGGSIIINIEKKHNYIFTEIVDQGVGMSEKTKSMLFRIENKSSMPGTHDEKGTGLGLILCKEFIEKNGGTISVESEVGKGSKFTFSLPVSNSVI